MLARMLVMTAIIELIFASMLMILTRTFNLLSLTIFRINSSFFDYIENSGYIIEIMFDV